MSSEPFVEEQENPFGPPAMDGSQAKPRRNHESLPRSDQFILTTMVLAGALAEGFILMSMMSGRLGSLERAAGASVLLTPCATFFSVVFWTFIATSRGDDFIVGRILKATIFASLATPAAAILFGTTCAVFSVPTVLASDRAIPGFDLASTLLGVIGALSLGLVAWLMIWLMSRQKLWR
ncbi:MAG: hypothetical protein VXZ82_21925 [Planctomycetota bacterium]|nr:hypothetical protein [Planctomycetota bacterium]